MTEPIETPADWDCSTCGETHPPLVVGELYTVVGEDCCVSYELTGRFVGWDSDEHFDLLFDEASVTVTGHFTVSPRA